jgi:hypothetical protein
MMRTLFLAVAAAMAAPAHGAEDSALLSLVAGYKAAFVCSALFNAGRTPQEIEANELHRIYPDYRAALAQLPAPQIDEAAKIVRVTYSQTMPPRIAVWRGAQYGCTQAPAGGDATSIPSATKLPRGKLPSDDDHGPRATASTRRSSLRRRTALILRAFSGSPSIARPMAQEPKQPRR